MASIALPSSEVPGKASVWVLRAGCDSLLQKPNDWFVTLYLFIVLKVASMEPS